MNAELLTVCVSEESARRTAEYISGYTHSPCWVLGLEVMCRTADWTEELALLAAEYGQGDNV